MEGSFEQYLPLMWRVLAALARHGFVLPPGEARDVIHDFYADEWAGLAGRFDPKKGGFDRYLFGAFYRFARRRVIDGHRHRPVRLLREPAVVAEGPPEDDPTRERRLRAIRDAVDRLDASQRRLLLDFLTHGGTERELAGRYGMTRHRLRETLFEAVGRVTAAVADRPTAATREARVAEALWTDGRPVRDAARVLGLTAPEVLAARTRFVEGVLSALRALPPSPAEGGTAVTAAPLDVLRTALLASADREAAVADVRLHAARIREALEDDDLDFTEEEGAPLEADPEWVSEVYAALAESDAAEVAAEANPITAAIRDGEEEDDVEIAEAFVECVRNLPDRLTNWSERFERVPAADDSFAEYLSEQPVVRRAGPFAAGLVPFGLTPSTFVEAARGLELLFNRLVWEATLPEEDSSPEEELAEVIAGLRAEKANGGRATFHVVLPGYDPPDPDDVVIPVEVLVSELRSTPQCPPEAAEPLLVWLVNVLQLRPFLLRGYEAEATGDWTIRLTESDRHAAGADDDDETPRDLVWRWTTDASARGAAWSPVDETDDDPGLVPEGHDSDRRSEYKAEAFRGS